MLGAGISVSQWLFWNLLPVTVGNLLAGAFFTGAALYITYPREAALPAPTQPATPVHRESGVALVEVGAQPM